MGRGRFWDGVAAAGDDYEIIGGSICGSFIVVGAASVLCYKPWRRRVEERRRVRDQMNGVNPDCPEDEDGGVVVEESLQHQCFVDVGGPRQLFASSES